jgi:hypothetical protein
MFSVDPIEQALSIGTDFVVAEMAPTLDQVSVTSEQHAIVWRRSTMGAGGFYSDRDAACLGFIERPKLSKDCDSAYDRDDDCFTKNCESLELAFRGKSPPAKPLWLPKTYFYSSDSIGCLVASVQQVLDCIGDLECDFSRESFTVRVVFVTWGWGGFYPILPPRSSSLISLFTPNSPLLFLIAVERIIPARVIALPHGSIDLYFRRRLWLRRRWNVYRRGP